MSDTSTEKSEMSELSFASNALQKRIAPVGSAQHIETRIRNAARRLGWKYSRTRDVWYGDERVSLKPRELRKIEDVAGVKYGREELNEIDIYIGRADAFLFGSDPDFTGPFADAARAFYRALVSAGTQKRD